MKSFSAYRVLFIIALIHAFYFIAALFFQGTYLVDSFGYVMQAENWNNHQTLYAENWNSPLLIDYFSIRPPLYAWIISALGRLTSSVYVLLFLQNILSIFNCWLVYLFALKNGCNPKTTSIITVIAILCYPAQMIHANFVMTEILFQSFLIGLFLTLILFNNQPTITRSLFIGVLLSLCLLTKPISLFMPFFVGASMLWSIAKHKANWLLIIPIVIPAMTFNGICMQNKHATGYYHYSSIKNINHLKYNARYTLMMAKGEKYADSSITAIMEFANTQANYALRLQTMNKQANTIIFEYPVAFCWVYVKGFVSFFLDPGRFDAYHFLHMEEKSTLGLMYELQTKGFSAFIHFIQKAPILLLLLLLVNLCWNTFVFLAFCYAVWLFIKQTPARTFFSIMLFTIVLYIAAATGPVGVSRYRVPVYPLLMLNLLWIADGFIKRKKNTHA
jgi:hypothetical protein